MPFLPQLVGGLLEDEPEVPEFKPIVAQYEQARAITGNLTNFDAAANLADRTNTFNQNQLLSMLRKAVPGYDNIMNQGSSVIQSYLRGEIPKDVSDQVARNAVESSLSGGFGGSGMARNLEARDLGLTSLQLQQKGLDSADRWMNSAAARTRPQMFDVTSMFISPGQQLALAVSERDKEYQHDLTKNQIEAEHSLGSIVGKAMIKSDDQLMNVASSM